jgi:hypothetical protein
MLNDRREMKEQSAAVKKLFRTPLYGSEFVVVDCRKPKMPKAGYECRPQGAVKMS